jgi:hypothetical protein
MLLPLSASYQATAMNRDFLWRQTTSVGCGPSEFPYRIQMPPEKAARRNCGRLFVTITLIGETA